MNDLLGLGKGTEKLIDVIASAVGAIYRPHSIRREAEAEAYRIKLVEQAKSEQKAEEVRLLATARKDEMLTLDAATTTLEERADSRKHFNELRKQMNFENVVAGAFRYMGNDVSEDPVDPDWLQVLIKCAEDANSEHMQDLWSRVLAGETESPGAYSYRSMDVLKKLSKKDAMLFESACHIASCFDDHKELMIIESFDNAVSSIVGVGKETIRLQEYGLGVVPRMTLNDIGLLHKGSITCSKFRDNPFELVVSGNTLEMSPKSSKSEFVCYHFTNIGVELAKLIKLKPDTQYLDEFIKKSAKAFSVKVL